MKKQILNKLTDVILAIGMIFTISSVSVYADEENSVFHINDSKSSDYGITAKVRNKNLRYIESSKASESEGFVRFKDDSIYEIYDLKMVYATGETEQGKEVLATTTESEICGDMEIEIPCEDPELNVIMLTNDVVYEIGAEYNSITGRMVFGTDMIGKIILTSDHVPYFENFKEEDGLKFSNQTIVDEKTKMQVSGKLPEDATMCATLQNVNLFDLKKEYTASKRIVDDFRFPDINDVYVIDESTQTTPYNMDWMKSDSTASGMLFVNVAFEKIFDFIEVDTPITVTIPFDYREFLEYSQTGTDVEVYRLNYRTGSIVPVKVLSAKDNILQFEANSAGSFFVGNKVMIEEFVKIYGYEYEDFNTNNTAINSEPIAEDSDNDINVAVIICIATNIIWLAVVVVLVVKNKKKNLVPKADSSKS